MVRVHRHIGRSGGQGGEDGHIQVRGPRRDPDAHPVTPPDAPVPEPLCLDVHELLELLIGDLVVLALDGDGLRMVLAGLLEDVHESADPRRALHGIDGQVRMVLLCAPPPRQRAQLGDRVPVRSRQIPVFRRRQRHHSPPECMHPFWHPACCLAG